jgi:hypothetical protein
LGRGVTSRRRQERLQMILTSPLEVIGGSGKPGSSMVLKAGSPPGDRVDVVMRLPGSIPGPDPCIPKDAGIVSRTDPVDGPFSVLDPPERTDPFERDPSIRSIFLFESLPGKGNEGRPTDLLEPVFEGTSGDVSSGTGGSQVPSNRPGLSPEGDKAGFLGGALETGGPSDCQTRRTGFHRDTGLRGSDPHDGACLPFCRGIGGTFTPLDPFSGTFSPRPFLRRSRRIVSDQVLGMRAKARSSVRRK